MKTKRKDKKVSSKLKNSKNKENPFRQNRIPLKIKKTFLKINKKNKTKKKVYLKKKMKKAERKKNKNYNRKIKKFLKIKKMESKM